MGEPEPSDYANAMSEDLVAAYLAGDDGAFTHLVGRYERKLYGILLSACGDAELAEEVFQAAFVKVAEKAHTFRRRDTGGDSFFPWLYRIANNQLLDIYRRRKTAKTSPTGDKGLEALPDSKQRHSLDRLIRDEELERVREALAGLPDDQREAFVLKEEGGLSFEEIGELQNCGRETAKSRFRLAVEKLRAVLIRPGRNDKATG